MSVLDRKPPEHREAVLQAYLRGSALLEDLDDLGLHQAAAHLSLALDVIDRGSALPARARPPARGAAPWGGTAHPGG